MKEVINRLLKVAERIDSEYDILMELSENNLERSEKYLEHCEKIKKYFYQEMAMYDELSLDAICACIKYLDKSNLPDDDVYERCLDMLEERQVMLETAVIPDDEEISDIEEFIDEELEDIEEDEVVDEDEEAREDHDDELISIGNYALSRIYIIAIKRTKNMIMFAKTETNQENRYHKNLKKHFRACKYGLLLQNSALEEIAILNHFDIDKLPNLAEQSEDVSPVYYNKCLDFVDNLCSIDSTSIAYDNVCLALFLTNCIDELITHLDKERLEKLKSYCLRKCSKTKQKTYGEEVLRRIRLKEKNN